MLPELLHFSDDIYCAETNTVYEFLADIGTDASVKLLVTSSPQTDTSCQADMIRQWHDWIR
jgi:hypothetical protein